MYKRQVLNSDVQVVNNQAIVRISSDQAINEPYVEFRLRIVDQAQILVREFTALLDIRQNISASSQTLNSSIPYNVSQVTSLPVADAADILGPYEWAEPGRVPAKFGPVLDGQSLWRVARRINTAMGVSIEQMMWALYTKNPDAFSNQTIESLRAGVVLDIPKLYEVSNISTVQAKSNIDNVSTNNRIIKSCLLYTSPSPRD